MILILQQYYIILIFNFIFKALTKYSSKKSIFNEYGLSILYRSDIKR